MHLDMCTKALGFILDAVHIAGFWDDVFKTVIRHSYFCNPEFDV